MRLIADMVAYTVEHVPRWNPVNICSYHLQEAGATPVQEIAFSLANAMAVLDAVRERVGDEVMPRVFGRISFFVNAGVRFVEEHAKLRAMGTMWERLGRDRYGVTDERHLRFRYGVQVNSLGLTESQPENNVQRIVLEALAVTLGRNARARSVQLPAWNEALGLPRPWDQQWSLRIQQVLAFETDLLEYPDIFEGSKVMDGLVAELIEGAEAELAIVDEHGGAVRAVDYMKGALVDSHRERIRRIEAGEQVLVGVNRFEDGERSPLVEGADGGILTVDPALEAQQRDAVVAWRGEPRPGGGRRGARASSPRPPPATRTSWPRRSPPPARARPPASGPATLRDGVRRVPRADRRRRGGRGRRGRGPRGAARGGRAGRRRRSGGGRRSSSASPASTGTPTAPSRSRSAPATSAWTSSTRASA